MLSRRNFFARFGSFIAGGVLGVGTRARAQDTSVPAVAETANKSDEKLSAARAASIIEGSIARSYDLVVVGGGISGVSAAISAARQGVKVALVHNRAMFGGNSSSEVKLFPEDNSNVKPWIKEGGLNEEFHTEERVRNHAHYKEGTMNCHWDLVLYEWVIREPNIDHYLNTHMHRVFMADASRIESIFAIQLGTEKSYTLSAPLFVDATGDGVLGGLAGADHRWGREARQEYGESLAPAKADEQVMGNTLFFTAKDSGKSAPFKRPAWAAEYKSDSDFIPRSHKYFEGGYWWIEVGAPYHPIADNNETRHEALRHLLGVWDHIKNQDCSAVDKAAAENYGLDFVGFWPYKRESRRIIGDYVLKQQDVQDPQPMDDAVAYGAWDIDIHVQGGLLNPKMQSYCPPASADNWQDLCTMVYNIPIRSLYSRNVENLMMAGRPISCSYLAFASSRVLSTGSVVGQAVGTVAAVAKKQGAKPKVVAGEHAAEVQQRLLRADCHIPGVENTDEADLAREAKVTASSQARLAIPDPTGERELKYPHAQIFPVSSDRLDEVQLLLRSKNNKPVKMTLALREAPHVWDFRSEKDLATATAGVPPGENWVTFKLNASVQSGSLYYVWTDKVDGVYWKSYSEKDGEPNKGPVGVSAAVLPGKTPYDKKSSTFRSIFADVELKDIPGAGKQGHWKALVGGVYLCMRWSPEMKPFGPGNINTGTHRPDKWTNIWVSDEPAGLPASVELAWEQPVELNTLQLTFDTDQNRRITLPYFRYPDCVKDYKVEYDAGAGWKELLTATDNYVRRREHRFEPVKASKLRVTVLATNGAPAARMYEVRAYNEPA